MKQTMSFKISALKDFSRYRPDGYFKDVLRNGTIKGDDVLLTPEAHEALRLKYAPRGFGDRVARVLKPIARFVDSLLGTNLARCAGCVQRQELLNKL